MRRRADVPLPRIFAKDECEAMARRVLGFIPGVRAQVEIESRATASLKFARGDAFVSNQGEAAQLRVIFINAAGQTSSVSTTRLDEPGLRDLIRDAQAAAKEHRSPGAMGLMPAQAYPDPPQTFFETTLAASAAELQAGVFNQAVEAAERASLVSAGDVALEFSAEAVVNTSGLSAYVPTSYAEFSMTARTTDGMGSGWGWSGYEDWSRVKIDEVIARAVDLGRRTAKPVAIEPGRYTVILEPTAVASLLLPLRGSFGVGAALNQFGPFQGPKKGTTKLGLQMLDRRLNLVADPWDKERPLSTVRTLFPRDWMAIPKAVTWFEQGVLKTLEYMKRTDYSNQFEIYEPGPGAELESVVDPRILRLEGRGDTTSLDDMIASTKRGVWVNRLSQVSMMNYDTMLLSGTTRDGTFLIENGKITKAIKNFRFTDSPLFALNKLEAFGSPVRAARDIVAPRLKVRDFDFTSLTDAI